MELTMEAIVALAREKRASDIHVVRGIPIRARVDGRLVNLGDGAMTDEQCERIAREISGAAFETVLTQGELDIAGTWSGIRCRASVFRQQGAFSATVRLLSDRIPELSALGLPPIVDSFTEFGRGIVLVTGETGSGKSTTLAAMLQEINRSRPEHIITLEDPIEYVYKPDQCVINQREVGKDTKSFASGLRAALREDPDVILVGEMRDLETIDSALTAAETGHLVFGTLHTNSAAESVDRMVNVFPEGRQQQIRMQLSMTLRAVIAQQLLPRAGGSGRAAACEIMVVNSAIRNLIREGKTHQIQNSIATSGADGCITMDNCLAQMVRARTISMDTALHAAQDADYLKRLLRA